jgi:uncharacterized protein YbaR (Trm112 family)
MDRDYLEMLVCPDCHGELEWQITRQMDQKIEEAEARCSDCGAVYSVREGIGIFLTPDLPRNDLWEQVDSQLAKHLQEHPDQEKLLLDTTLDQLSPTDLHFRAMLLEERGDFRGGKEAEILANQKLYTEAYQACWERQFTYILDQIRDLEGPVIDLASGRCYLVERILEDQQREVVVTDFSPSVLRRDREYFRLLEQDHLLSYLAFDARKTPFREKSVGIMTTNLGLPNIENPGELVSELHRILGGKFLGISHFFPPEDEPSSKALPTPVSKIIPGARADGLPVAPTEMEWCTVSVEV